MTFEQITTLLDRGFTPDQITALASNKEPATHSDQLPGQLDMFTTSAESTTADREESSDMGNPLPVSQDPPTTPAAAPDAEPVPASSAPVAQTAAGEFNDSMSAVMDAIADVKKTIQAANIRTMSMDVVNPDNSLEKAMAEIIRPSFEKGDVS